MKELTLTTKVLIFINLLLFSTSLALLRPLTGKNKIIKITSSAITCYSGGSIIFADTVDGEFHLINRHGVFYYTKKDMKVILKGECVITENF